MPSQHRVSAVEGSCPLRLVSAQRPAPFSSSFQHPYRSAHRLLVFHNGVQAIKQQWLEFKQQDAVSDTDPLTDVEYDNEPAESDAAGGTPGSSLAAAGTSSQTRTLEHTPPPAKKP